MLNAWQTDSETDGLTLTINTAFGSWWALVKITIAISYVNYWCIQTPDIVWICFRYFLKQCHIQVNYYYFFSMLLCNSWYTIPLNWTLWYYFRAAMGKNHKYTIHIMTLLALLPLCEENPLVTTRFPLWTANKCRALICSLLLASMSYWSNSQVAGDLKHYNAHVISL